MHKKIDSNFAIAILALVAACVGFSFWFLNVSDDIVSAGSLAQPIVQIVKEKTVDPQVSQEEFTSESISWVEGKIDRESDDDRSYSNITFFYPENLTFFCCHSFGGGSSHFLKTGDQRMIAKITKYNLIGCPGRGRTGCGMEKAVKKSTTEVIEDLIIGDIGWNDLAQTEVAETDQVYLQGLDKTASVATYSDRYGTTEIYYFDLSGEVFTVEFYNQSAAFIAEFMGRLS